MCSMLIMWYHPLQGVLLRFRLLQRRAMKLRSKHWTFFCCLDPFTLWKHLFVWAVRTQLGNCLDRVLSEDCMETLSGARTNLTLTQTPFCGIAPNRLFSWTHEKFRLLGQKSELIGEAFYLYKFKTTTKSNANIVEVEREESSF